MVPLDFMHFFDISKLKDQSDDSFNTKSSRQQLREGKCYWDERNKRLNDENELKINIS